MMTTLRLATRKSTLAIRQTELLAAHIASSHPDIRCEVVPLVTTGDIQTTWSLAEQGGKGLFTKEIEEALLEGTADLAVHSAKDLPTEMHPDLEICGYLTREDPRDMLITRADLGNQAPSKIATSSPRRRMQGKVIFPTAVWGEIRGNIETRLKRIVSGASDATFLACAGLNRLGFSQWEGLTFHPMPVTEIVPAVGQGAIAIQSKKGNAEWLKPSLDKETAFAVSLERSFLAALGGGCHSAIGAHFDGTIFHIFAEPCGYMHLTVPGNLRKESPLGLLDELISQARDG